MIALVLRFRPTSEVMLSRQICNLNATCFSARDFDGVGVELQSSFDPSPASQWELEALGPKKGPLHGTRKLSMRSGGKGANSAPLTVDARPERGYRFACGSDERAKSLRSKSCITNAKGRRAAARVACCASLGRPMVLL